MPNTKTSDTHLSSSNFNQFIIDHPFSTIALSGSIAAGLGYAAFRANIVSVSTALIYSTSFVIGLTLGVAETIYRQVSLTLEATQTITAAGINITSLKNTLSPYGSRDWGFLPGGSDSKISQICNAHHQQLTTHFQNNNITNSTLISETHAGLENLCTAYFSPTRKTLVMVQNHYNYYLTPKTQVYLYNGLTYEAMFLYNRTSNFNEATRTIPLLATTKTLLGPIPGMLGNNPTASSIIRDWIKYLTAEFDSRFFGDVEIGHTGIYRTKQELEGTRKKVFCKTIILTLGGSLLGKNALPAFGLSSNFICDSLGRIDKVASREHQRKCAGIICPTANLISINNQTCTQDRDCLLPAEEYKEKYTKEITRAAIQESIPKTFTSDIFLGETIKPGFKWLADVLNSVAGFFSTKVCFAFTGQNANFAGQHTYTKIVTCLTAGQGINMATKVILSVSIGLIEGFITFINEFIKTNIFVPIVSAVADGGIPKQLFGSIPKIGSTVTAAAVTTACISSIADPTKISKGLCFLGGIGTKALLDTAAPVDVTDQLFGSVAKFGNTVIAEIAVTSCVLAITNPLMKVLCLGGGVVIKTVLDVAENKYGASSSVANTITDIVTSNVVTSIPNHVLGSNTQMGTTAAGILATISCLRFDPTASPLKKALCLFAGTVVKVGLDAFFSHMQSNKVTNIDALPTEETNESEITTHKNSNAYHPTPYNNLAGMFEQQNNFCEIAT